jgi:hypothetical protein
MALTRHKIIGRGPTLIAAEPMVSSLISIYSEPVMTQLSPKYVKKRSLRQTVRFVTLLLSTDQFI